MSEQQGPSPIPFFEAVNAYQRTAAIRAAVELALFTAVGEGKTGVPELAERCGASERGIRILADYLVVAGFLTKDEGRYGLTPDSAVFLDQRSPAYAGGAIEFLLTPALVGGFQNLTTVVRTGTTALGGEGMVEPDHPVWVKFARGMMALARFTAEELAEVVECVPNRPLRVLDVAAGHGMYGLAFAKRYPQAEVTALDWANVLQVAKENAAAAGAADRYRTLEGSAFEVDWGGGYDLVLLTNFLHHFDVPTCEGLLRRAHAALAEGGRAVTLEFVPNEDRVSPPGSAAFALTMLASTGSGDAYTFPEYEAMFRNAGFSRSEVRQLGPRMQQVIISER